MSAQARALVSLLGGAICFAGGCSAVTHNDGFDNAGGAGGVGGKGGGSNSVVTTADSASSTASVASSSSSVGGSPAGSTSSSTSSTTTGSGGSGGGDVDAGDAGGDASDLDAGPVVFSDDFESNALGMQAAGWTRVGGSNGDWEVVTDLTKEFAQDHAQSTTFRLCYGGPVLNTAATVSAQVKITKLGSSGTTTALVCVRYPVPANTPYACLALEAMVGAQIKTGGADGPVWPTAIVAGTSYDVKLSVDAAGSLTAYLDGAMLGTFAPNPVIVSGAVAVATQSAEAEFDNVVLTTP